MAPGVEDVTNEIKKGDEVIVYSPRKEVIGTGKAYMNGEEMIKACRGMAVKIRWRGMDNYEIVDEKGWDDVVEANIRFIHAKIGKAKRMIKRIFEEYKLPYVVSFSGGKDSLATLFLLLDAGYSPPLFFIDTGLEFDETVDNVHEIAKNLHLKLIEKKCDNTFWQALKFFGPPARDFRWCCKTCKLGPATLLIKAHFPKGVISFIGQRRYESEARAKKGGIWVNPWVPQQIGVSPIQNWTALHVWLYLFFKKKEYGVKWNPLYEEGFHRIGCWLCPASDIAEFLLKRHRDWEKFERTIQKYINEHHLDKKWKEYELWRWRDTPSWAKNFQEKSCSGLEKKDEKDLSFNFQRVANFMNCIGHVTSNKDIKVKDIKITKEGLIYAENERDKNLARDIIKRAIFCVGCGVCAGRCRFDALFIEHAKAWIDEQKCTHCMQCIGECPIVVFGRRSA
jgi:phosphoadenosine phosphosulfate reductase